MDKKLLMIGLALGALWLNSCSDDDDGGNIISLEQFLDEPHLLIANQGPFGSGNGTVTRVSADLTAVSQNYFSNANAGSTLGNIVQSIGFYDDKAVVVSNNSNFIDVVDRNTFAQVARIDTDLIQPRYFVEENGKGYVTCWGDPFNTEDDYVAVVDLMTYNIITTIAVAEGPERIISNGTALYVAQQGGFGYGNTITVIDPLADVVVTTIEVGDVPNSLALSNSGMLYVSCSGKPSFSEEETPGSLYQLDTTSNAVATSSTFVEVSDHLGNLQIDGDRFYYTHAGQVYQGVLDDFTLVDSPIDQDFGALFTLAIKDGLLYGLDAGDFASQGEMRVYDLNAGGAQVATITTGIVPGGVFFNE